MKKRMSTGKLACSVTRMESSVRVLTPPADHVPRLIYYIGTNLSTVVVFIGDCAPLSFFQTVRQFVISRVDPNAFAPQTSRFSMLENTSGDAHQPPIIHQEKPKVDPKTVDQLLSMFAVAVDHAPLLRTHVLPLYVMLTLTLREADLGAFRPGRP